MGWHTQAGLVSVGVGKACHRTWPLSPVEGEPGLLTSLPGLFSEAVLRRLLPGSVPPVLFPLWEGFEVLSMTFSVIPRLESQRVSLPKLSFSTAPSSHLAPSLLHNFKAGTAFCTERFKVAQLVLAELRDPRPPKSQSNIFPSMCLSGLLVRLTTLNSGLWVLGFRED